MLRVMSVVAVLLLSAAAVAPATSQETKPGRRGLPFPPRDAGGSLPSPVNAPTDAAAPLDLNDFRVINSLCGPKATWQEVELYRGDLGPSMSFVNSLQKSAGQIQWNANLDKVFNGADDDPGNVQGRRWCSGSLISDNLFLTAAHCFEVDGNGWRTPRRGSPTGTRVPVWPAEIAKLMHVNFDYQVDGSSGQLRQESRYPVVRMVEYGFDPMHKNLDYAIIELGPGADGIQPSQHFGSNTLDMSGQELLPAALLTVIQHPNGAPKKIAAGPLKGMKDEFVLYSNLDTIGGSSGAPVYAADGRQVAVHTNGGCDSVGTNRGVLLKSIRERNASNVIK